MTSPDRTGPAEPSVRAVGVVVPAHDEEATLPGCLAALLLAAAEPRLTGIPVLVVVVADDCADTTVAVARSLLAGTAGRVMAVRRRNVGAARAAGFAEVLAWYGGLPPAALWLATTDADTLVPPDWLTRQVDLAGAGWDAVAGTVRVLDWGGRAGRLADRFDGYYSRDRLAGDGHLHVHGANLGLSAAAYAEVGGIPPLALAEDHALVAALRARGRRVLASGDLVVTTSGRRQARAAGGFGDLLTRLEGTA